MSCQSNTATLFTTTQQLRAVHEFGLAQMRNKGCFVVIGDISAAASILEEDGRSTSWFGSGGPAHWRDMSITPDNCPSLRAFSQANAKAYSRAAQIPIFIRCRQENHPHIAAQRGPHGQRTYPFDLRGASRGKVVLLADRRSDSFYRLWRTQLERVGWASEYKQYYPLIGVLHDLLDENEPLEGNLLYTTIEERLPSLRTILSSRLELGAMFDPDHFLPNDASGHSWSELPFYVGAALDALRDDYLHFSSNGGTPFVSDVRLLPGDGNRDPCLMFPRRRANVLPDELATRRVIVPERDADFWRPLLTELGMQEMCWADVLMQPVVNRSGKRASIAQRRGPATLRWILVAGRELMTSGSRLEDLTQRQLAREAGVDPATVSRHWAEIRRELAGWWEREGPGIERLGRLPLRDVLR